MSCGFDVSSLDIVSWRVWEEEETDSEDDTPEELNADWDSVSTGVGSVRGRVDDTRCEQDTDGDTELVTGDQGTSNFLGALRTVS